MKGYRTEMNDKDTASDFISVSHLDKKYHTMEGDIQAIKDVSFSVRRGEFVSVLGPSGCGKSTMLLILAGLLSKTEGDISIDGKPIEGPQTNVGIIFQDHALLDWRTVLQNIMLQIEMRKMDRAAYLSKAMELLESVGLSGFENKYPFELSGGMRQRVSICRSLIHSPPLLLMDEPLGALDALTREQMRIDIEKIWLKEKQTVLFITHSITEATLLADRVIVMTQRPGEIHMNVKIDLPRPRHLEVQESEKFTEYCKMITDVFLAHGVLRY
jgi:NitT/TauT family transport system ATP-binding protein